ncbi:ROK family glucokinase [Nocardioides limicola]|uniref:ROK family glucokinase n=1 Tax=Nocardioides limicola TaxID=2803368 RepID=UPI00193C69FD|nr:ROK family glucokinase [Nocardioides sp. DJM-14]
MTTLACGVDVGGTKIAAGVVDTAGTVLAQVRAVSPAADPAAITDTIVGLVDQLRAAHDVGSVGVGAAGFIDADRATVRFAPNIAWREEPLGAALHHRLGLSVVVENDANAAAWGEYAFGAGRGADTMLTATLGTGVGGGLILGGHLHRGSHGMAAEIGHLRLTPDGPLCGCGKRGCLETYSSGTALVRRAREDVEAGLPGTEHLRALANGAVTGPMVTEAAMAGDRYAITLLAEVGRHLGYGLASLCAVLDPDTIVIGGGMVAAGELVLGPARDSLAAELSAAAHRPPPALLPATLGNTAGLIGAADLSRMMT